MAASKGYSEKVLEKDYGVGSIFGIRAWDLNREGELMPITRSSQGPWLGGENIAVCGASLWDGPSKEEGETEDEHVARKEAWKKDHDMTTCDHGLWAYLARTGPYNTQTYLRNEPRVVGVIEGYGEVIVGTEGFRAMKARIRAISFPDYEFWQMSEHGKRIVTANYPKAAVFTSIMAMLEEFPINRWEDFATVERESLVDDL